MLYEPRSPNKATLQNGLRWRFSPGTQEGIQDDTGSPEPVTTALYHSPGVPGPRDGQTSLALTKLRLQDALVRREAP
jgi:hypothetical protein